MFTKEFYSFNLQSYRKSTFRDISTTWANSHLYARGKYVTCTYLHLDEFDFVGFFFYFVFLQLETLSVLDFFLLYLFNLVLHKLLTVSSKWKYSIDLYVLRMILRHRKDFNAVAINDFLFYWNGDFSHLNYRNNKMFLTTSVTC